MRRKLIEKTAILVVSMTVISGCGVSYKDYSDTNVTQEDLEKPDEIETRCEYVIEDEVAKLPSDVVIIDDYSKEGTIFTSPHLNYDISIKVNKVILADNMDGYKEIGGTDSNFMEWIEQVSEREAGFTNIYDKDNGMFYSRYEGVGTKIFMISAELDNNSESEATINIDGIRPYYMDKGNGEITRLNISESIFHDYAESTGADRGYITLMAGERRNIVLCMVEPDKIIQSYYKNEDDKIVAAATEDIDYDNIYLRLSLLGVQQVANGENFIKVNIE